MLFMLVAPVVFFSLIDGVVRIRDRVAMRRLGGYTLGYYLCTTAIAIGIGLAAVLVWHPWTSRIEHGAARSSEIASADEDSAVLALSRVEPRQLIGAESGSPTQVLKKFFLRCFQSPFAALADVNILAIVLQGLLIGIAIVICVPPESPLIRIIHDLTAVFHTILGWIILTAPIGVFAIVFDFNRTVTGELFGQLISFGALVFGATMLHGIVVLPLLGFLLGGVSPIRLFSRIGQPLLVALTTASSAATLPITLSTCQKKLDVPEGVASFVCPLGATMNMDGTALFEGIAAVFLAWLYGVDLGTGQIVAIFAMAMVSSIGAPGMPSGSMSGMQMVLLAAGIPLEAIGILLVIERPLDTFRTAVNVEGDIVGALVVNRWMGSGASGNQ
jgi:Na+/H+-dicarboxylate symporter